ncbi:AMIN domain-containing protein [Phormidium sp. CLA17]|uniref:type IV pilus secretin family protein n=1 Tax=Leptolyngbya sp. Cla-17 TaxID=2803751 RepID=UPI001491F594|nr:type IV pilus secretin family protein [Leptolyngbya sp. Cla-17]MBM0742385.1 AMIN domain-containing protein [Leptolyngbya sp. Cla-17]
MTSLLSSAAIAVAAQPALATAQVTSVQLTPAASGVKLLLQTNGGDRPQVFSVNRGRTWTADLINTQLEMPGGRFQQANPAPGISMVTVAPIDRNSVRVTVMSSGSALVGQVTRNQGALLFSLTPTPAKAAKVAPSKKPITKPITTAAKPSNASLRSTQARATLPPLPAPSFQAPLPTVQPLTAPAAQAPFSSTSQLAQIPPASVTPSGQFNTPSITPSRPSSLQPSQFPGQPIALPPSAPIPLPRAVPPPVGDIAVSQSTSSVSDLIELGTAERVPRLVLRDASAREVLSLLARSAGLNLAFSIPPATGQATQTPTQAALDGPKITLDIENEPIQNVFNYVLQITGLEANRIGRTIFVGSRLPNSARSLVVQSLRLNQVPVTTALNFLVGLGAESAVSRERLVTSAIAVPFSTAATATPIAQTQTTTETRIESQRLQLIDSVPILRGLSVLGDERTNSVTLTGSPKLVNIAISQLTKLDIRRRQVAVNVRVIDINLASFNRFGSSFAFGVNDTQVINQAGVAVLNFGRSTPGTSGTNFTNDLASNATNIGSSVANLLGGNPVGFVSRFLLQLQASVRTGNAKILTDPTVIVQEGQTATVNLTQDVITNFTSVITGGVGSTTTTITAERGKAGLILPIQVDRIDDNGFISLSVAPSIARPYATAQVLAGNNNNTITLLSERRLQSGQIRLRDGQTLIVSGIIQDLDQSSIQKVPILGDIPLLGALFRRTEKESARQEVIVLLTPRVLDDTNASGFGYGYTPSAEGQKIIDAGQR